MDASVIKSKIRYVAGLEYLYAIIAQDQLDLPPFVTQYDNDVSTPAVQVVQRCIEI